MDWRKKNQTWRGALLPLVIFILFFSFLMVGIGQMTEKSGQEKEDILRQAIKRATVSCYAIEGMYPPNIAYLEANYGIVVDHQQYAVYYEAFASNILPDIKVINLTVD